MCGIAGILDRFARWPAGAKAEVVREMCRRMRHRGPDAEGHWTSPEGRLTLGHLRLSIIDLDARSHQPMHDPAGRYVVAYNGELYNYLELRAELEAEGVVFHTTSDTEVLLQAWARWGHACFERFDGMFALAMYDRESGELVLARDRTGEKPLYVARSGDVIAFCSELKPLLALPGLSRDVSDDALADYFSLRYVHAPRTIFSGITQLQPGTWQHFAADGRFSERSYFAFDLAGPGEPFNEARYLEGLHAELKQAVRTRMLADVPVGAFLSSGVDSSLVCSIAAKDLGSDIRSFGAGFAGSDEDNETDTAREIARHLGLPFEQYIVSEEDLLGAASAFGARLDEPNGDRSCVPTYFLSGLVRRHVTVAISGDGGDELFGGYTRYLGRYAWDRRVGEELQCARSYFQGGLPMFSWPSLAHAFPDFAQRFDARIGSRFVGAFARKELDAVETLRLVDFHSYLPGSVLAKVDRMAMRHSLEVRTPFFSPGMLELSAFLPRPLATGGGLQKLALRKVLARYLPDHLVRPAKQGFGMPASFFRTQAAAFSRLAERADEALAAWAPLEERGEAFAVLRQAARDNMNSYWAWIALGQWVESIDGVTAAAAGL
ncbi:MAG TPA: asparagine synthase (glutamine-hydrolyzing) [Ramlibacter sp.]|uniref:asparagine synthase (glutamine-hydrolyzing) n=1 Tax=Ramlibacter sp. TaxID=1917967 RepID=UPI002B9F6F2F|nr:asparagine synthase (glutamine-hydrolyzing) [Ramlibacter sp.]HVZ47054.1 asparagine synthase (glutamine-hydrolyzing) [Ramlibacter sp.]